MKKILLFIALTYSLLASDLGWTHDYKAALAEAKKENKSIYVLLTSDNCRWCRKFENTTLQEDVIKQRLAKNYITVHLSRDTDEIPEIFETTPVPRHYFVDNKGKIVYESLGHRGVECFEAFMDNVEDGLKVTK